MPTVRTQLLLSSSSHPGATATSISPSGIREHVLGASGCSGLGSGGGVDVGNGSRNTAPGGVNLTGSHQGYGYVQGVPSISYSFASYSYFPPSPHGSQIQLQAQASSQPHAHQTQPILHSKPGQASTLSLSMTATTSAITSPVTSSPKQQKWPFDGVTNAKTDAALLQVPHAG
jgi:hypothetical protein